ncbi:hypothetical protein ACFFU9_00930 [Mariniflexile ostreae]|uniref:Uncharacterized protein n=1 Tax=Mariniflexile ostreae TaxID=1520892 RepID=A0ABV5F768_9FLAO
MKNVIFILTSFAILVGVSCREEKTKTEKIIIEKQVETPKPENSDGTSFSIDKEGVEFSNKKGDKKTEININ